MKESKNFQFALCVDNRDTEDLEIRKIYEIISDADAEKEGYLRIIDESGEDYLYPKTYFFLINLPREAREALQSTR